MSRGTSNVPQLLSCASAVPQIGNQKANTKRSRTPNNYHTTKWPDAEVDLSRVVHFSGSITRCTTQAVTELAHRHEALVNCFMGSDRRVVIQRCEDRPVWNIEVSVYYSTVAVVQFACPTMDLFSTLVAMLETRTMFGRLRHGTGARTVQRRADGQ